MNSRSPQFAPGTSRRKFLRGVASGFAGCGLTSALSGLPLALASAAPKPEGAITARNYLSKLLYTRKEVDDWLDGKAFPFAKYSAEFGWLLRSARFKDGQNGSISVYTYGELDERITIHYRGQPCRINTYGNSYTQCHQVSDAETWQEVLAAHLQEPVRNFGVGGWSVYQSYLRMLREEKRVPAEFIIFNIYDDDHLRSLDSWRNIRVPKHERFIEPTLPHVVVNAEKDTFEERANICPTPESVYNLCDIEWVASSFKDDFALKIMLAHANAKAPNPERATPDILRFVTSHGIVTRVDTAEALSQTAESLHRKSALYSSTKIVQRIEAFAAAHGKKVLYVLSYPPKSAARFLQEGVRSDQPFVDFLKQSRLPFVDLLAAHAADFALFKGEVKDYISRHWVGHYNPKGNFFCAQAILPHLIEMLNPKPLPYRPSADTLK